MSTFGTTHSRRCMPELNERITVIKSEHQQETETHIEARHFDRYKLNSGKQTVLLTAESLDLTVQQPHSL